MTQKLIIDKDTPFKSLPLQADALKTQNIPHDLVELKAGAEIEILAYEPFEGAPLSKGDDHLYIVLPKPLKGEQRGFIYGMHCHVEGTEPGNDPKDKPAVRMAVPMISIPGIRDPIPVGQAIYAGSHFSWAEFTKGGSRIPVNETISQRIVKLARYMDEIREFLGDRSITITSGYRDPVSNRRVGGASNSRHMYGDAVDFAVEGMSCVEAFKRLKRYHTRGGLAVGCGFVHLDLRPGAAARWRYPGGPNVALW